MIATFLSGPFDRDYIYSVPLYLPTVFVVIDVNCATRRYNTIDHTYACSNALVISTYNCLMALSLKRTRGVHIEVYKSP